jgi:hypothetical protein
MKKKFKCLQSVGKVLLMTFWDAQGILEFLDHKAKVNADHYRTTLWQLKEYIQMKHLS